MEKEGRRKRRKERKEERKERRGGGKWKWDKVKRCRRKWKDEGERGETEEEK